MPHMTMLQDPRPLESPDYWDTSELDYDSYCDSIRIELEDEFGVIDSLAEIRNNYYAEGYFQRGADPFEAADAIARDFYCGDE